MFDNAIVVILECLLKLNNDIAGNFRLRLFAIESEKRASNTRSDHDTMLDKAKEKALDLSRASELVRMVPDC